MSSSESTTPIKFNFYSLRFFPYKDGEGVDTSNSILHDVIGYLTKEKENGKGHLIDKNHNRPEEGPRELFMVSSVLMLKEKRIRCSLALLRAGRVPQIKPVDKFKLVPIESIGTIAEETHFYIDYSKGHGIICIEYNHNGPRISDIEYYLRNVARDKLKKSRQTEVHVYMDSSIDKTLADLKNVLKLDIKLQPRKLAKMDTALVGKYFSGMNSIGNMLSPAFLKIEALFQTPGKTTTSKELNNSANNMVLDMIKKFKGKQVNIELFENFVVKYEDKDGKEEVFNLLSGKKEIIKDVDLTKIKKSRDWYALIEKDFDEFVANA